MLPNKTVVQSIFNNETAFGELDYIFKCEGNQEKEIVNRVVNKIGKITSKFSKNFLEPVLDAQRSCVSNF
jgi:hypothetical protein